MRTGEVPLGVVVVMFFVSACSSSGGDSTAASQITPPPLKAVDPVPDPISAVFTDATSASGIDFQIGNLSSYLWNTLERVVEEAATGGVAAGDYDGDGDIDLFITSGNAQPNRLYRNDGNLVFTDRAALTGVAWTKSAGENYWHSSPTFGDIDGDGDLDLFLGGLFGDPSLLFVNNGNGTFTDITAGSGIDTLGAENNMSAAFGDYDLDGDIDLLIAHWGTVRDTENPGDTETLWRNDTDATGILFISVSVAAGISPSILMLPDANIQRTGFDFTWAPSFARINDDLYPDIVISADFNQSQVFINNQDGTFINTTDVSVIVDQHGMGSALGDYDNDGDLDWFVTSIHTDPNPLVEAPRFGNRLYSNDNGVFADVTDQADVADGRWGWGTCFIDLDNDGDLDIYHTNGWPLRDGMTDFSADLSRAFFSDGAGTFDERAADAGLDDSQDGRGVVCADFDEDGDVDIFQTHRGLPVAATMWRNDSIGNNYVRVKLRGLPPNTEAAGARIFVKIGDVTQMREIIIGNNFVSQNPTIQVIGIGNATQVDEVRVEWPDGLESSESNVAAGRTLTLSHPAL